MATKKWQCRECYYQCHEAELLRAKNPFDGSDMLGCPSCKCADCFLPVCEIDGCKDLVTQGFLTDHGYMQTCGRHGP